MMPLIDFKIQCYSEFASLRYEKNIIELGNMILEVIQLSFKQHQHKHEIQFAV